MDQSFPLSLEQGLLEWKTNPGELGRQLTLYLERLRFDPCELLLPEPSQDISRFLQVYKGLVRYFCEQILAGDTPSDRSQMLVCIIDVASFASGSSVGNAALTVACLQAVSCEEVQRLRVSWRQVSYAVYQCVQALRESTGFSKELIKEEYTASFTPSRFLQGQSIPYLPGAVKAARCLLKEDKNVDLLDGYRRVASWCPLMVKTGDWYPRMRGYMPLPNVQVGLVILKCTFTNIYFIFINSLLDGPQRVVRITPT